MATAPLVDLVMTRNPATVSPKDKIRTAVERMVERKCRRLPVVQDNRRVGIISHIDLRRATNSPFVLRDRRHDEFLLDHFDVGACMTRDPKTVTPRTPIVDAAKLMRDDKIGGLPVVQGDKLVGIVTLYKEQRRSVVSECGKHAPAPLPKRGARGLPCGFSRD